MRHFHCIAFIVFTVNFGIAFEIPKPFTAARPGSFSYYQVKIWLPNLLQGFISSLNESKAALMKQFSKNITEDYELALNELEKLEAEIINNVELANITDDYKDVGMWNTAIGELGAVNKTWRQSPIELVLCYFHRRVFGAFQKTDNLKDYDINFKSKASSYDKKITSIDKLSSELPKVLHSSSNDNRKSSFRQLLKINVWANRCDMTFENWKDNCQDQSLETISEALDPFLVLDQSSHIWEFLNQKKLNRTQNITVDLVLDNAGFELFTDLCIADFIMSTGLVDFVRIYPKDYSWFVSDTTEKDITWLINQLKQSPNEFMNNIGGKWAKRFEDGDWVLLSEPFMTSPYSFDQMQNVDKNFYKTLSKSDLILFKGDLNYSKLLGGLEWMPETSFEEALRGFHPAPLCTVRTLKGPLAVGLPQEKVANVSSSNKEWMVSGKYAIIQCAFMN